MADNAKRILVIGGGIAGLAAAHRLVELAPAAGITLFERSSRLGGVLSTVHEKGYQIEDRKSTRLNSSHTDISRMPSSA